MIDTLFTEEGAFILASEVLVMIEDNLTKPSSGIINTDFHMSKLAFDELGISKSIKHFDCCVNISAKEKQLDFVTFSKEVLEPIAINLVDQLNLVIGDYNTVRLPETEGGSLCSIIENNGISVRAIYGYDPLARQNKLSVDIMVVRKETPKVFLGGTCNGSLWREALINELEINYFNPVVEDWTPECMDEELKQRKKCDICLYVITPKMTGTYSIAEVVDDSNKRPGKTVFCVTEFDTNGEDTITYDPHAAKSLQQVARMVQANGAMVFQNLTSTAKYLNG